MLWEALERDSTTTLDNSDQGTVTPSAFQGQEQHSDLDEVQKQSVMDCKQSMERLEASIHKLAQLVSTLPEWLQGTMTDDTAEVAVEKEIEEEEGKQHGLEMTLIEDEPLKGNSSLLLQPQWPLSHKWEFGELVLRKVTFQECGDATMQIVEEGNWWKKQQENFLAIFMLIAENCKRKNKGVSFFLI
ncbi:hypothetical protein ACH5RR_029397 [Cinchona calisaya]|uniref:Uncharacterized protein n=1 Tax=Cinchona calisaya TaxID=153742 RepID=A0ABD2YTU2_9GENT